MGYRIEDMAVNGEKLYFIPNELALIVEFDLENISARAVARMSESNVVDDIGGIIQSDSDYLYIAPFKGNYFYIVDRKQNQIVATEEFKAEKELFNMSKFRGKFVCDKYIGFIGYGFPGVAVYEKSTNRLMIQEIDLTPLGNICEKFKRSKKVFGTQYTIISDFLYIPFYGTKDLLILNLKNLEYEIKTDYFLYDLIGICGDGSDPMWLIPMMESKLIKYDLNRKVAVKEIEMPQGYNGEGKPCFINAICHKKYIWIFSSVVNDVIKIDRNTYEITYIKQSGEIDSGKYICAGLLNDKYLWASPLTEKDFCIIDMSLDRIDHLNIYGMNMSDSIMDEVLKWGLNNEMVIKLNQFVQYVEDSVIGNNISRLTFDTGNEIWTQLKGV